MPRLARAAFMLLLPSVAAAQPYPLTGRRTPISADPPNTEPAAARKTAPAVRDAAPQRESAGATQASPPARRSVRTILETRVPEVNFVDEPLERVANWLERQTGLLVYVRWPVLAELGINRDSPISVKAHDRPLSAILWVILKEMQGASTERLAYQASDQLLVISTDKDLSRELITRVYDICELLFDIPNFRAIPGAAGPGSGTSEEIAKRRMTVTHSEPTGDESAAGDRAGRADENPPRPRAHVESGDENVQELLDMILATIEPASWEERGGAGTLFLRNGKLIVRNSRHVHQLLGGLGD